jgi:hypothetical protein
VLRGAKKAVIEASAKKTPTVSLLPTLPPKLKLRRSGKFRFSGRVNPDMKKGKKLGKMRFKRTVCQVGSQ